MADGCSCCLIRIAFFAGNRGMMEETRWSEEEQRLNHSAGKSLHKAAVASSTRTMSTLTNVSSDDLLTAGATAVLTISLDDHEVSPDFTTHTSTAEHLASSTVIHAPASTDTSADHNNVVGSVVTYFSEGYEYVLRSVKLNYWRLLGTAGAWFILDVVFYANGLFSGQVLYTK